MVGNLDSIKVLVFVFAITLLTSLAASTEGGIDQVELEPKTLGPGDEKIVTIVNVEDDGGAADGSPDGEDLYINYLTVSNYVPKSSEIPDNVLGSEINNMSIWTQGGTLIESNASHQLNSKEALLGSQDGESIHTVSDDSSENLNIKIEMDSNIAVSEDGTGIRLLPKAWATTDGSAFSYHSAGYTPNTSIVDARPEISSATTLDQNGNGKLDAVNVSFTESVELSNPEGGSDALPGLSVGSYELENHDYNGDTGEYHTIDIVESYEGDTGATPEVSYSEGENTIIDADQLENELRGTGGVTPSDGAAPVADVSYENNGSDINYVDVEFSEPVESHSILDANDWSWQNPGELNQISNTSLSWDQETPEREFRIDILNGAGKTNLGDTTLKYTDNGNIGDGTNSFSGEGSPYSLEDEASPSLIQTADLVAKDKVQVNFSEEVDGGGDNLEAGDFNFTGEQDIVSVSGTGFSRQVNITFSEDLESSNLGSNTINGSEGDSVGVEENSVQDEADNYAELDPVGLSDPQGLIDSNGSTITCDLNVSKSGQSYNSIQNAVNDATTEDTVCVHNGFYKESVDLDKNITLISPDGATLSFPDSTNSGALIDVKAGYSPVISGFSINDSNFQGQEAYWGKGIEIRGDAEPLIRNLNFLDTEDQNNIGHAVDAQDSTGNWKLRDTKITGIDYIGIRAIESSGDYVIDNVTVKNSDDHAIEVEKSTGNWMINNTKINETGGDGIDAHKVSSANIRNVEIYNADLNGINLHDANTSGEIRNVTIKNINNSNENNNAALDFGSSSGDWKVVESVITNGTGDGISAYRAGDAVNASYNYWGAPNGPDGYYDEKSESHYTDGSGGDADFNVTVRPYYKDEAKTQLSTGSGGSSSFGLSDNYRNSSGSPGMFNSEPNATFIGHGVDILNGDPNTTYEMRRDDGSAIDNVSGDQTLDTSGASTEGRVNVTDGTKTEFIDLIDPEKQDVAVRATKHNYNIFTNDLNTGEHEVKIYNWLEGTEMEVETNNKVNVSSFDNFTGTNENTSVAARLNISDDKFWVEVNNDQFAGIEASRSGVDKPRVRDVHLDGTGNITGTVGDSKNGDTPLPGVKVMISRSPAYDERNSERTPYSLIGEAPPVLTETTNSTGGFKFENLSLGSYSIEVVGSNYSKVGGSFFQAPIDLTSPGEVSHPVGATNWTGNISVNVDAPGNNKRYLVLAFGNSSSSRFEYAEPSDEAGWINLTGARNGTYAEVIVAKFDPSVVGSSSTQEQGGESAIEDISLVERNFSLDTGEDKEYEVEFKEPVYVNGSVEDESGKAVEGASLKFENRTEGKFHSGFTDENGDFSVSVSDGVGYNLEVRSPRESNLNKTSLKVDVNGSETLSPIVLGSGSTLEGTIKDGNGNRVEAYVNIWSEGQNVNDYDEARNGSYKMEGLVDGTYTMVIEPKQPRFGSERRTVEVNGDTVEDVTLQEETKELTGTVKNTSDSGIDAKVNLYSYGREGSEKVASTTTDDQGSFSFNNMGLNTFYRVRVLPNDTAYSTKEDGIYFTGEESVQFVLEKSNPVAGYIKDGDTGEPVDARIYAVNRTQGSRDYARTGDSGRYSLDLSENSHNIYIESRSYPLNATNISKQEISSGELVNFTLSTGEMLEGTVKGDGRNLSGRIAVWNETKKSYGWTEFENGNYSIEGLQGISHNVWIQTKNETFEPNETTVDLGSSDYLNFTFNKTASADYGRKIKVTVLGAANSSDPDNATVFMEGEKKYIDSSGEAKFSRQPVGENLTMTATAENYKSKRTFQVVQNKTQGSTSTGFETYNWHNLTITLPSIRGTQFDARVNITDSQGQGAEGLALFIQANESDSSRLSSNTRTASNGIGTVEGLVNSTYNVGISVGDERAVNQSLEINSTTEQTFEFEGTDYSLGVNSTAR